MSFDVLTIKYENNGELSLRKKFFTNLLEFNHRENPFYFQNVETIYL